MDIYHQKIKYERPFVAVKAYVLKRELHNWSNWHVHKETELLYIFKGGLDVYTDKEKYAIREGDIVFIGSNQLHRDLSLGVEYLVFQFDSTLYCDPSTLPYFHLFSEFNASINNLNNILEENKKAKETVIECVLDIYKELREEAYGYEMAISLMIRKLLLTFIRYDRQRVLRLEKRLDKERLNPLLDYIERNIEHKITAKQAARMVNMSYSHFAAYFKKVVGMTFVDYMNYRRIKVAERIMLTEDINIEETAIKVGMENRGHFNRMFKKFNHCTPKQFRCKMLGQ